MSALQRVSARLLLLTAASALCASTAFAQLSTSLTVMTDKGPVTGGSTSAMNTFLGIPYATPPVGALRWKAPQPTPVAKRATPRSSPSAARRWPRPYGTGSTTRTACTSTCARPTPRPAPGDGVDPRRRDQGRRERRPFYPGDRGSRAGAASSSSRSTTGSACSASSRTRRSSPRRPTTLGQLRHPRPAGGAAVGPAQHRQVRRRPGQRHRLRRVRRRARRRACTSRRRRPQGCSSARSSRAAPTP